jgi:hypothetical protein
MFEQYDCAALVDISMTYSNILVGRFDLISFVRKSENIKSRTLDHKSTDILIYPE